MIAPCSNIQWLNINPAFSTAWSLLNPPFSPPSRPRPHAKALIKRLNSAIPGRIFWPVLRENASGFDLIFGFLSWYQDLPCICNSVELEPVILHGLCYILVWSLCIFAWYIFACIFYIWPCLLSILHGICHILAFQPFICMVFATFWYFKRSCGSLEGSLGFHLGCHLRFL